MARTWRGTHPPPAWRHTTTWIPETCQQPPCANADPRLRPSPHTQSYRTQTAHQNNAPASYHYTNGGPQNPLVGRIEIRRNSLQPGSVRVNGAAALPQPNVYDIHARRSTTTGGMSQMEAPQLAPATSRAAQQHESLVRPVQVPAQNQQQPPRQPRPLAPQQHHQATPPRTIAEGISCSESTAVSSKCLTPFGKPISFQAAAASKGSQVCERGAFTLPRASASLSPKKSAFCPTPSVARNNVEMSHHTPLIDECPPTSSSPTSLAAIITTACKKPDHTFAGRSLEEGRPTLAADIHRLKLHRPHISRTEPSPQFLHRNAKLTVYKEGNGNAFSCPTLNNPTELLSSTSSAPKQENNPSPSPSGSLSTNRGVNLPMGEKKQTTQSSTGVTTSGSVNSSNLEADKSAASATTQETTPSNNIMSNQSVFIRKKTMPKKNNNRNAISSGQTNGTSNSSTSGSDNSTPPDAELSRRATSTAAATLTTGTNDNSMPTAPSTNQQEKSESQATPVRSPSPQNHTNNLKDDDVVLLQAPKHNNTSPPKLPPSTAQQRVAPQRAPPPPIVPFSWDLYLEAFPSSVAPKEAFNQPAILPENKFKLLMKIEARDPRNPDCWCLATVIGVEGLRIRLRFDGGDTMNDFSELIDSPNIRPVGSETADAPLLPPISFKGNLATYPKFVEKVLSNAETLIAPPDYFPPEPAVPKANLFEPGMKLEAVDRKHREIIAPATIASVDRRQVEIQFDGWRGSFDYTCQFDSRDLFPINWCRDTYHSIQPPNGWPGILKMGRNENGTQSSSRAGKTIGGNSGQQNSLAVQKKMPPRQQAKRSQKSSPSPSSQRVANTKAQPTPKFGRRKKSPPHSSKTNASSTRTREVIDLDSDDNGEQDMSFTETLLADLNENSRDSAASTSSEDRFQCQRTVAYAEWLQRKKDNMKLSLNNDNYCSDNGNASAAPPAKSNKKSTQSSAATGGGVAQDRHSNLSNQRLEPKDELKNKRARLDNDDTTATPTPATSTCGLTTKDKRKPILLWSVQDVADLLLSDETLAKYSKVFKEHEIDGKGLTLLTRDVMMNYMCLKIGPVLKIQNLIEQIKLSEGETV